MAEYASVHPDNISVKVPEPGHTTFPPGFDYDHPALSPGVLVDLGYNGDFFDPQASPVAMSRLVEAADILLSQFGENTYERTERAEKISAGLLYGLRHGRGTDARGSTTTGDAIAAFTFAGTSEWVHKNGMQWGDVKVQIIRTDHSREPWIKDPSNRVVFGLFKSSQQLLYGSRLARLEEILRQQPDKPGIHLALVDDPVAPILPRYKFSDHNLSPFDLSAFSQQLAEIGEDGRFAHKPFAAEGNVARGELRHESGVGLDIKLGVYLPSEFQQPKLQQGEAGRFTVAAKELIPGKKRQPPQLKDIADVQASATVNLDMLPWVELENGRRVSIDYPATVAIDRPRWGAVGELTVAAKALRKTLSTDRKTVPLSSLRREGKEN